MTGTGQTIFALAALAILSLLTLNANRLILFSFQDQLVTKQTVAAMAQGNSLLEEIQSKPFDETVVSPNAADSKINRNKGKKVADLTAPPLGPEKKEVYPFDDLDDYNGYQCKAYSPLFADSLRLSVKVFYVTASNPSIQSNVATPLKKVTVNVLGLGTSRDTLKLAFVQVVYQ